jgi:hypothetical protein
VEEIQALWARSDYEQTEAAVRASCGG